jgi:hypothetical protein
MYHFTCRACGKRFTQEAGGWKYCSMECRFWSKVRKTRTCWLWQAYVDDAGYGRFSNDHPLAHVFAYELTNGEIADGLELDHTCRNRACVNPAHLEPVTHLENMLRGEIVWRVRQQQPHCPKGHLYTAETTITHRPNGEPHRRCRICRKEFDAAKYQRRKLMNSVPAGTRPGETKTPAA